MSKFVRSNGPGSGRLPGMQPQRLYGDQVAMGEPIELRGNADLERDIHSSLEIIAQERLREVEAEAKSLIIRARTEAAKILEQANNQAKALLDQAKGEEEGIRENAHEEGFKTGYAEGYADATTQVTQETQDVLAGAQTLLEGAYLAEQRVMKHVESNTLALVRHIVKQIINRELTDSPATVLGMVECAVASLYMTGKVQVVVSAQVIHDLRAYATETAQSLDGMSRFEFVADPALDRHQIYIIGQDSCFDLSPDTQLDHLLAAVEPHFTLPRDIPAVVEPEAPQSIASDTAAAHLAGNVQPLVAEAFVDEGLSESATSELSALSAPALPEVSPELATAPTETQIQDRIAASETHSADPTERLMSQAETLPEAVLTEPALESTAEADPVAWEEFPADLQELEGFPTVADTEELALETPAAEFPGMEPEVPEDESLS